MLQELLNKAVFETYSNPILFLLQMYDVFVFVFVWCTDRQ